MLNPEASLLVVDDEAPIRKNLSTMFSALGYATRTASNGFSALDAIRDESPDLLLSDLNMPGMSGFELLSVVRRRFPSIRVIAMSGAFTGTEVPPGVAADAFYEKGSSRIRFLVGAVEAMTRPRKSLAGYRSPRSAAPIWIPPNGHDPTGKLYVMISCPECLRTFPQVLKESGAPTFDTKCAHCSNPICYAIVHSADHLRSAAALYLDHKGRRHPGEGQARQRRTAQAAI
jgi:CheY-like chemotaxis protein